jgi:hypothetical protein
VIGEPIIIAVAIAGVPPSFRGGDNPMRPMLLGLLAGTILSGHALAWGPEGHQVVASIAENALSAATRA